MLLQDCPKEYFGTVSKDKAYRHNDYLRVKAIYTEKHQGSYLAMLSRNQSGIKEVISKTIPFGPLEFCLLSNLNVKNSS